MTVEELHRGCVDLIGPLEELRGQMIALEAATPALAAVHPAWRASARNLVHYLALRRNDLRPLQVRLAQVGLSSLGRAEGGVYATVDAVLAAACRLADRTYVPAPVEPPPSLADGHRLLSEHTEALLGPRPTERKVRIMVTLPGEAADHPGLIRELLAAGMDCARINCAHDGPAEWARMLAHLRQAEAEVGRPCRVLMDLAGPKLRTGPLPPGPRVLKVRPTRDELGRVLTPARVWLTAEAAPRPAPEPVQAVIPLRGGPFPALTPGDVLGYRDARAFRRRLRVTAVADGGCRVDCDRTVYFLTGTLLSLPDARQYVVGDLPPLETRLRLNRGDVLTVVRDATRAGPTPPAIGCALPEVFDAVRPGQPIWFDDGRIGGVIREVRADGFEVQIHHCSPGGAWLGADKGINLPETDLDLPCLTPKDESDLAFVAAHADMVGYSFVRHPRDVRELRARLARHGRPDLGIVLKIETRQAFHRLPGLLLAAMHGPAVGVMIARGDLAVECGFERLAEVQEEMLWICEAAHVPVVWATQVLEGVAKQGLPSRAEITDAAMGERAECVMLNKGPHVVTAVILLAGILRRMQAHQAKKRAMLRRLAVADARLD